MRGGKPYVGYDGRNWPARAGFGVRFGGLCCGWPMQKFGLRMVCEEDENEACATHLVDSLLLEGDIKCLKRICRCPIINFRGHTYFFEQPTLRVRGKVITVIFTVYCRMDSRFSVWGDVCVSVT